MVCWSHYSELCRGHSDARITIEIFSSSWMWDNCWWFHFFCKGHRQSETLPDSHLDNDDDEFCISLWQPFKSIPDLILHYSQQVDGLCGILKDPCVVLMQQRIIHRLEISHDSIHFTKMVELCEHYKVWQGEWCKMPVTIRIPREGFVCIAKFYEEEVMKKLKNDNIIKFYGICTQKNPLRITELTNCGNLREYLNEKGYTLMNCDLLDMGVQIALAMHHLEGKRCAHWNLQAIKITLHSSNTHVCKVAIFTYAKIVSEYEYVESTVQENSLLSGLHQKVWDQKGLLSNLMCGHLALCFMNWLLVATTHTLVWDHVIRINC